MSWASIPRKALFISSMMGSSSQYSVKAVLAAVASAAFGNTVCFTSLLANSHQQKLAQKEMYG